VSRLVEQIRKAFSRVEYPGDDRLTDSFGDEAEALVEYFRDKRDWQALTPEFMKQAPYVWGNALAFFSGEALRFYLAAYLIADIEDTLVIEVATTRLCAFVTPMVQDQKLAKVYGGGTLGEHARKEFELFDAEQVSAIVAYLWWKLDNEGYDPTIEQALENYWLEREAELNRK